MQARTEKEEGRANETGQNLPYDRTPTPRKGGGTVSGTRSQPPKREIDDAIPILQVEADMQLAYFTDSNQSVLNELNIDLRQYRHPHFLERAITSRRHAVKLKLEEAKKAAKRNSLPGQARGLCTPL